MMLFFDLPMETPLQRREYNQFRKSILKMGFIMEQKSVYSKLALNSSAAKLLEGRIEKIIPSEGLIEIITITEKQYSNMKIMLGEKNQTTIKNVERILVF